MKYLLPLALIFSLLSCSAPEDKLIGHSSFRKSFTKTEIADLQLLFDFFNRSICIDGETESLTDCYLDFFKRMEDSVEAGVFPLNIPFESQKEIYEQFSDSSFFRIWTFSNRAVYREHPTDTFRSIYFRPEGKYFDFLRNTSQDDPVIDTYYKELKAAGDITPSLIWGLLTEYDHYNIEDIRVKFIVAIHYLSLNDQYHRRERVNNQSS